MLRKTLPKPGSNHPWGEGSTPARRVLQNIGAILLIAAVAAPFLTLFLWRCFTSPTSDSFGATQLLHRGALNFKQSPSRIEKYSNPDAVRASVLAEYEDDSTKQVHAITSAKRTPLASPSNFASERNAKLLMRQLMSYHPDKPGPEPDLLLMRQLMSYHPDKPGPEPDFSLLSEIGRDDFESLPENEFKRVEEEPVSTFSADVDTSSYSYIRQTLNGGFLPQSEAVRSEEMINYFDYEYLKPKSVRKPFSVMARVTNAPWAEDRKLLHIGIKGYDVQATERRFSNLVFLIDVSGSMSGEDRLPLVKSSMELLLPLLDPEDSVAIVSYANTARVVLGPTLAGEKDKILDKIRQLQAGGGTGGARGLELAYELAEQSYDEDAINRIILATDGDFNIGPTDNNVLQKFIESKREKGIYLSVLGYGMGNYKDSRMKALANHGNGVAAYIDTLGEAKKVLFDEASGTLFPIANDVKLQVEFNPTVVSEYRLVGYEKRVLKREDFNNDAVDAGEIGSGHTVTAIYEITPRGPAAPVVDELRYSSNERTKLEDDEMAVKEGEAGGNGEYAFLKIRYKLPDEKESKLLSMPILTRDAVVQALDGQSHHLLLERAGHDQVLHPEFSRKLASVGTEFDFSTAVASFAELLRGSKHVSVNNFSYDDVIALAEDSKGVDKHGYRSEFIELVRKAKALTNRGVMEGMLRQ